MQYSCQKLHAYNPKPKSCPSCCITDTYSETIGGRSVCAAGGPKPGGRLKA
jgi:hypothetical protein